MRNHVRIAIIGPAANEHVAFVYGNLALTNGQLCFSSETTSACRKRQRDVGWLPKKNAILRIEDPFPFKNVKQPQLANMFTRNMHAGNACYLLKWKCHVLAGIAS